MNRLKKSFEKIIQMSHNVIPSGSSHRYLHQQGEAPISERAPIGANSHDGCLPVNILLQQNGKMATLCQALPSLLLASQLHTQRDTCWQTVNTECFSLNECKRQAGALSCVSGVNGSRKKAKRSQIASLRSCSCDNCWRYTRAALCLAWAQCCANSNEVYESFNMRTCFCPYAMVHQSLPRNFLALLASTTYSCTGSRMI